MMKNLAVALVIILSITTAKAQQSNQFYIDSLKHELTIAKEDTNKVWVLNTLSQNYTWSFADTAVLYAQQALELSQRLNFKEGAAWAMAALGIGLTTLGNYSNALSFFYKALALFKELKDSSGLVKTHGNLGVCYREQEDYKQAIENIQESMRLQKLSHEESGLVFTEGMLSAVLERNNQLDSALVYANRSYSKKQDWSGLLTVLGAIHSKLGNNQLAIEFYKKAIPLAIRDNFQIDILDAYNGIAQVYLNEGKTDSAIYYAKQALFQEWERVYPIGKLHASTLLANIYESQNKTDSTLKYLKLTNNLKDSLFNQQKTREAQSFAFNEQFHQQELQQQLTQSKLQYRNRLNVYILLAGLLILLLVAGGLWRKNIYKQKSFALLQKQKQEIDLQKAKVEWSLHELKSTQAQLIHSEKMASLGELTAGIAHEIQNPLNFVNNFSEVNKEMLEELKAERLKPQADRDDSLQDELINDVINNEEKINHHGKRADAIVKGMLQHSKQTKGIKEPTDINALCDEYLRLSFHGMRAKDKSFNAEIKTDFDENIGKINVVPQDIGRVLLNLFNNAFYAVNEKGKLQAPGYKPQVIVQTKKLNDKVEIKVSDNGNGIPQNIIDKIFQPFFTTKPTGQGTGLGLSLSYDIITKEHNGKINVESREAEGSTFIINLPV
jgi:signal transduction histidine kinase/Flp pilus assembly protein TadD